MELGKTMRKSGQERSTNYSIRHVDYLCNYDAKEFSSFSSMSTNCSACTESSSSSSLLSFNASVVRQHMVFTDERERNPTQSSNCNNKNPHTFNASDNGTTNNNSSENITNNSYKRRRTKKSCGWCGTNSTTQWRVGSTIGSAKMETLCNACGINYRRALLKASSLGSSSTQRGNGESSKSSTQDQQDMDMNTMSLEDINLDRLAKEQEQTGYSKLSIQKALKQQIKRKDLLTLRHRTRQMPNLSLGRIPVSALIDSNPNPNPNPNPSSSSSSSVHQNQRNNTLHTQSPYNLNPTTAATATPLTHSMLNSIFNVEVPPPSPPQQRGSLPHGDAMSAEHQNQQDSGRNSNMNNQSPPVSAERGTQQEQQQFEQRLPPFQSFLNHLQHGHKNHSLK